jgi:signal peptidase
MNNNYLFVLSIILLLFGGWYLFSKYTPLLVTTGSMSPRIPKGTVVFIQEIKSAKVGEVITYKLPNQTLVTHRVISMEKLGWEPVYQTKGDANEFPDDIVVGPDETVGKVIFTLPYLGYALQLMISPLFLLFFFYLPIGYAFGSYTKKFVNQIRS